LNAMKRQGKDLTPEVQGAGCFGRNGGEFMVSGETSSGLVSRMTWGFYSSTRNPKPETLNGVCNAI